MSISHFAMYFNDFDLSANKALFTNNCKKKALTHIVKALASIKIQSECRFLFSISSQTRMTFLGIMPTSRTNH